VGGLALESDGLRAVDGHVVPLRDGVDAGSLLAGVVGAGGEEGVGVEGGGAVGNREDEFDMGDCDGEEEEDDGRWGWDGEAHVCVGLKFGPVGDFRSV